MVVVRSLIVPCAAFLVGCQLVLPINESTTDASIDTSFDAPGDASADVSDGGSDVVPDRRVQDNSSIFCGPNLVCSTTDPNNVCCVAIGDSGTPPTSYVYSCEQKANCTSEAGSTPIIACDQNIDCGNGTDSCCWGSLQYPIHTYCFTGDSGSCGIELCDPDDANPCPRQPGYQCVPSGPGQPTPGVHTTPLGYFVCSG